jgi:hypothetical protein
LSLGFVVTPPKEFVGKLFALRSIPLEEVTDIVGFWMCLDGSHNRVWVYVFAVPIILEVCEGALNDYRHPVRHRVGAS